MENKDYLDEVHANLEQGAEFNDRRYIDRRKEPCEGFTYISTVGWICRREQSRRKEDFFECDS
jgi:hypothetical protein